MITKILKIQGVGLFDNAIPRSVKFSKITTIYGENGTGKSTLSNIFSSLVNNNPSLIIARKTIGATNNQEIQILINTTPYIFSNNNWDHQFGNIILFDSEFVNKNIYSGFTVLPAQRESLLEFTLGEIGGRLKKSVDELNDAISKTTSEIRENSQIIAKIGYPLSIDAYIALQSDPEIESKIEKNEKIVASLKNVDEIVKKSGLSEIKFSFPDFDILNELFRTTISTISEEAKQKVIAHISAHMKIKDEQWIKRGLDLIKSKNCPFCAKDLEGSEELLKLYQQYFDESYQRYQTKLQAFQRLLQEKISDIILAQLQHSIELNHSIFDSNWKTITTINLDSSIISEIKPIALQIKDLSQRLITIKIANPLSAIKIDQEFDTLVKQIKIIPSQIETYNQYIRAINEEIQNYKRKLQTSDLASALETLTHWRMRKARYESPNREICLNYNELIARCRLPLFLSVSLTEFLSA